MHNTLVEENYFDSFPDMNIPFDDENVQFPMPFVNQSFRHFHDNTEVLSTLYSVNTDIVAEEALKCNAIGVA